MKKKKKHIHSGVSQSQMIYFATAVFHRLLVARELGTWECLETNWVCVFVKQIIQFKGQRLNSVH